ncbi:glycosyltransferase [Mucisphaera sp.]|uniref:glycosyltransferase n=1 Tax=Mucisphaera sp. TaxID=2913024 RepID=UPI003D111501
MLTTLLYLWTAALAGATLLWGWINIAATHRSTLKHPLEPDTNPSTANLPPVALLAPGRNEAEHLPQTLPSLASQNYPDYRCLFIDDDSTDDTRAITARLTDEHPNLHVLHNTTPPPEGWVGKPHAIYRGYQHLLQLEQATNQRDEWLCFTDADIHWHPDCLRSAMRLGQQHNADLIALYPGLRFGSVAEAIVQVQLVLALGVLYPFDKAMDPKHPDTLTGGAFMLVRRSHYDAIHGHESVKNLVVEDLALGKKLKKNGARVRLAVARDLLWCRMYNGWQDQWEGLTKNAYGGLRYNPIRATLVLSATLLFNILPALSLPLFATAWALTANPIYTWPTLLALAATLLGVRAMNASRKFAELPWPYALSLAPGSILYLAIILASIRDYYTAGNTWKGRTYGTETKPRG